MAMDALGPIAPLTRLNPLAPAAPSEPTAGPGGSGFAAVLNGVLAQNQRAGAAADAAVRDLATGQAESLHEVTLAVAEADVSFRLLLELRNRLTEAFQEVIRMQV